ncbi:kelch repeat-containing protein [Marinimicrobium sp. LS-A18]|uniref:Kelch repeat-containing protein n=1 Tax=Marinimicrobium sp. LS-A18 TaxID=1381596 RepID=UPI00046317E5|nr:kelch repeat-containing protein [Marinimicrobium sp. LS-A18]
MLLFESESVFSQNTLKSAVIAVVFGLLVSVPTWALDIVKSPGPDRAGATLLDGEVVRGDLYAFIDTNSGIKRVRFYVDGTLVQTEGVAPWDLAGTEANNNVKPYNTLQLSDGAHDISAAVTLTDNSVINVSAQVQVDNQGAVLEPDPASYSEKLYSPAAVSWPLTVGISDGSATSVSLVSDQPWLTFENSSGSAPFSSNVLIDTSSLSFGVNTGTVTVSADGVDTVTIPVEVELVQGSGAYQVLVSGSANRSSASALSGQALDGNAFIFTSPDAGVKSVAFFLNNPTHSGSATKIEGVAPFDFAGTATNGTALPYDTSLLPPGNHSISTRLTLTDGTVEYASGEFTVGGEGFYFQPDALNFMVVEPELGDTESLVIDHPMGANEIYTISSTADWLTISPDMEVAPSTHTVSVDVTGLEPGNYQAQLVVEGSTTETIPVTLSYQDLASNTYGLQVSTSSSRSGSVDLGGAELSGNVYIHLQPEQGVSKVDFYLNASSSGTPTKVELAPPYDFVGTASSGAALALDTNTLPDGEHLITTVVHKSDGGQDMFVTDFTVKNTLDPAFTLSPSEIVASAFASDGTINEILYLGLNASADGSSPNYVATTDVSWLSVEPASGVAPDALTVTLNPAGLPGGTYEGQVTVSSSQLPDISIPVSLTVLDGLPLLVANPASISLTVPPESGIHTTSFELTASDDSFANYQDSSSATWLTLEGTSGTTPETVTLKVDSAGLALGLHQAELTLTAGGYAPTKVTVTVEVTDANVCSPVDCSEIRVELPYVLEFDEDRGGVEDIYNGGTGFTYVLPSSKINAYLPENMELDTFGGVLDITSSSGILHLDVNNQANPVGVGFPGPNQITKISTQINAPSPGTGKYEQAGLWFGYDEDNYVKLVQNSFPGNPVVEFAYEKDGVAVKSSSGVVGNLSNGRLDLELIANPSTRTVTAYYSVNGGFRNELDTFNVETEFFSFDAAGIDPVIGTRSFTGIMTTHRHGASPITYEFERFAVEATESEVAETTFDFVRKSHDIDFPTSMVWAPDGKLYVTELFGTIHALTYDDDLNVVSDEIITSLVDTLGPRLTLGITLYDDDPTDDSSYSLWVASSSPSVNSGVVNSSTVTRLSGTNFEVVEQVITGLPRAIANHAINSLHFGADDKLYIAVGGNTGAGSPVIEPTEFGDRAEQPLSAAIVVADVFAAGFDGSCSNEQDMYGPAPCDVVTYATGLRNTYDFVFHSNAQMYATDNGLGVTGAFPDSPTPDCSGLSDATPVEEGGNNPGPQSDALYRVQQGAYYGHPNPSRDECVFGDGSYQGVAPLPNYEPRIGDLGMNASANGIIEFRSGRACGKLETNLMAVRYSLGDDIVRVQLSEDGMSVESQEILVSGFNDPLTLSEHNGDLFVGEFGSGKVTALRIEPVACWSNGQAMPEQILDAGSVVYDGDLYSVAGKLSSGPINSLYLYNPVVDQWSYVTEKPGAAVENPAVTTDGTYLYVAGGSTGPFSGAVAEFWRYDPWTNNWSQLPDMPIALGGIQAKYLNGQILVAGGMNGQGASVNSLLIYDVASGSWSSGPNMVQQRDNAGTAVVDGKLYVMSGRYRLSGGDTISEGLPSMEVYDPQTMSWTMSSMPRGRRAFAVGEIDGKLQVVGGESNPGAPGDLYHEVDVYDPITGEWSQLDDAPAPRHGPGFGTIDNRLIVTGGGGAAGSSFTNTTQVLTLD